MPANCRTDCSNTAAIYPALRWREATDSLFVAIVSVAVALLRRCYADEIRCVVRGASPLVAGLLRIGADRTRAAGRPGRKVCRHAGVELRAGERRGRARAVLADDFGWGVDVR